MNSEQDRRKGFADGLRELADLIEADPCLPLPFDGTTAPLTVFYSTREQLAAAARALGGSKVARDDGLWLHTSLRGVDVQVRPSGNADVCERVQVGTKTETVYDVPEHVKVKYARNETVPVFEVRCPESILRPDDTEAVPA